MPQPSLRHLDQVVDAARASGLGVEVTVDVDDIRVWFDPITDRGDGSFTFHYMETGTYHVDFVDPAAGARRALRGVSLGAPNRGQLTVTTGTKAFAVFLAWTLVGLVGVCQWYLLRLSGGIPLRCIPPFAWSRWCAISRLAFTSASVVLISLRFTIVPPREIKKRTP